MCMYIYICIFICVYKYIYICMYKYIYIMNLHTFWFGVFGCWLPAPEAFRTSTSSNTKLRLADGFNFADGKTNQQVDHWQNETVGSTWNFLANVLFFFSNYFFEKKTHTTIFFSESELLDDKNHIYRKKSVRWSQDEMVKGKTRLVYLLKKNCLYWYHRYLYLCLSRLRLMPGWDFQIHEAS